MSVPHSHGLDWAWGTAAREAARLQQEYIEPEHLLFGIVQLEQARGETRPGGEDRLESELGEIESFLISLGTTPQGVRDSLGKVLVAGDHTHSGMIVHRSGVARSRFVRAQAIAQSNDRRELCCVHVIAAMFEVPNPAILELLRDLQIRDLRSNAFDQALKEERAGRAVHDVPTQTLHYEGTRSATPQGEATVSMDATVEDGTLDEHNPEATDSENTWSKPTESYRLGRVQGPQKESVWVLPSDGITSIGRSDEDALPDVDLRPDFKVSRLHARIWFEDEGWWIEDLDSKHGTRVADQKIAAHQPISIQAWDEVYIGNTTLMLAPPTWLRIQSDDLVLDFESRRFVNLGLTQCQVPIISKLIARNWGGKTSQPHTLRIELSDLTKSDKIAIPPVPAGQSYDLGLPDFHFDFKALQHVVERRSCSLSLHLDDSQLDTSTIELHVLPANEWAGWRTHSDQLSLSAFVLPNHPGIKELVRGMSGRLSTECSAEEALRVLYEHLSSEWSMSYRLELPTWNPGSQRIRLPHDVLFGLHNHHGHGTCLDVALVLAACLEQLHFQPLVAILEVDHSYHALVGCWQTPKDGLEPILLENERLLDGVRWIDPNGCTSAGEYRLDFEPSSERADMLLRDSRLVFALDVAAAREIGRVEPLPFSGRRELNVEARQALDCASELGRSLRQPPGTVHLLIGLLKVEDGFTPNVFRHLGLDLAEVPMRLEIGLRQWEASDATSHNQTRHHEFATESAQSLAARGGSPSVSDRHLFEALLATSSPALDNALENLGTSRRNLRDAVEELDAKSGRPATIQSFFPS